MLLTDHYLVVACTTCVILHKQYCSAKVAFLRLQKAKVWSSRALSLATKLQFLQPIVVSVLLYGGETWTFVKALGSFVSISLELS